MSNRAFTKWPLVGSRLFWGREGDTISGVQLAAEYTGTPPSHTAGKPDVTALPELGVVKSFQPFADGVETKRTRVLSGRLQEEVKKTITAEGIDVTLDDIQDIAIEQAFGLSKLVSGTEQIPGNVRDRRVRGWLAARADNDGATFIIFHHWVEITMKSMPKFGTDGRTTCELHVQFLYSSANTIEVTD